MQEDRKERRDRRKGQLRKGRKCDIEGRNKVL